MSNIEKFFELLKTDKELQQKLKSAAEKFGGDKRNREAVASSVLIPIAAAEGLSFSVDELEEYLKKLSLPADGAELSTDELKAVAGGMICVLFGGTFGGDDDGECELAGESDGGSSCILVGW